MNTVNTAAAGMTPPIAWTTFFSTPLPPLPAALIDLVPASSGVPGRALPMAKAIRKLVMMRLWPTVQGDRSKELGLVICCNSHPDVSWWIRTGADQGQAVILQQLTILLAWRMKQMGDPDASDIGPAQQEKA